MLSDETECKRFDISILALIVFTFLIYYCSLRPICCCMSKVLNCRTE